MDKGKTCDYTYAGRGEYLTGCGGKCSVGMVRELDLYNYRHCPRCGGAIVWPDPTKTTDRRLADV